MMVFVYRIGDWGKRCNDAESTRDTEEVSQVIIWKYRPRELRTFETSSNSLYPLINKGSGVRQQQQQRESEGIQISDFRGRSQTMSVQSNRRSWSQANNGIKCNTTVQGSPGSTSQDNFPAFSWGSCDPAKPLVQTELVFFLKSCD